VLISDLQNRVAYTAFLNRLLPERLKFSLAKRKVTTLADALRRTQNFIQSIEIYAGDEFVHQESGKRLREERDA